MTVANLGYKPRPARVWAGSCRPVVETVLCHRNFGHPLWCRPHSLLPLFHWAMPAVRSRQFSGRRERDRRYAGSFRTGRRGDRRRLDGRALRLPRVRRLRDGGRATARRGHIPRA